MSDHESYCVAKYTTRDLILYALGIGCTSKCCGEERFLIENQHNFEAFPLYPLALGFTSIPKTIIDAKKKKPLLDTSKKSFDYAFWGIHPFPPYSMKHYSKNGTFSFIPERFIVSNNGSDEDEDSNSFSDPFLYPMIHISQSLSIFHNMPVPCRRRKDQEEDSSFNHHKSENPISIVTKTSIVKVVPKRIGTFVTTKTDFYLKDTTRNKETHNSLLLLSTGYSCSLILNVPSEKIIPFHDNKMSAAQHNGRTPTNQWNNFFSNDKGVPPGEPDFTHTFNISDDQAILYRLSGDYNPLHIDSNISSSFLSSTSSSSSKSSHNNKNKNKTRPILHGLCTLGFAVRAALQYCDSISGRHSDDKHVHQLVHVFTKFKRPVFIGDELLVHIWNITHTLKTSNNKNVSDTGCIDLLFQVTNLSTKSLCLDEGVITVKLNPGRESLGLSKL